MVARLGKSIIAPLILTLMFADQLCPYVAHIDYAKLPTRFEIMFGPIDKHCTPLLNWCEKNCMHKYRSEWERVIQDPFTGEYLPNCIGGSDELFFGFKDERDYIMFTLRWG